MCSLPAFPCAEHCRLLRGVLPIHIHIAGAPILFKKHKIYLLHANTCLLVQLANTTSASPWKTPSHFAVPQKPLPRDFMRAKLNITPRLSRKKSACGGLAAKKTSRSKPCLLTGHAAATQILLPQQFRFFSIFFCRHFFWLFFALPCRFACVSGTRRQNCTRYTKEIRFPPGRSRPVFPAEDKSSFVLLPSTYLICQIKYFLDVFCEIFLGFFGQKTEPKNIGSAFLYFSYSLSIPSSISTLSKTRSAAPSCSLM